MEQSVNSDFEQIPSKKSLEKYRNLYEYFEGTRPLFLTIELFHDNHKMLTKLCKTLIEHKRDEEAKAISHKYDLHLFTESSIDKSKIYEELFPDQSSLAVNFPFYPVSKPMEDYLTLPEHIEFKFLDASMDFTPELKKLIGQQYIGLDAEWRPVFNWGQKEVPSILQIATEQYAFIIDLKSFDFQPQLYKKLD